MPRDLKRIKRILKLIEVLWEKNPDLRLCQLIGNCFGPRNPYYREDDELEEALKNTYCKDVK
jgi:uncharacterized protein YihD (DUF1040 family)